jgi:ATP-dependent Clp protease ATP-binding subunit ClpA
MAESARLGKGVEVLLQAAEDEARQLGHPELGAEHLLLGALRFGHRAALVPDQLGITLEAARAVLREQFRPIGASPNKIMWFTAAERSVAAAVALANALRLPSANADMLLLTALDDPDSKVPALLSVLGVQPVATRQLLQVELLQAWWYAAEEPDTTYWLRLGSTLTAEALWAFRVAKEVASQQPPHIIAPEQWLYALTEQPDGAGDRALAHVAGDSSGVRTRLGALLRTTVDRWPGSPRRAAVSATLRVRWEITAATDEALRRRAPLLSVEHLLLGLVQESLRTNASTLERVTGRPGWEGGGTNVLELIGLDSLALQQTLAEELDQPST